MLWSKASSRVCSDSMVREIESMLWESLVFGAS
jgi:hypothetical protein